MPSALSSLRSITKLALGSAQVALFASSDGVYGGTPDSCPSPQLSCHNTSAVANTCCFNAPGGQLLQTQFWDTNPSTGPDNSWTVHGLWPDHCDGTYDANCDPSRAYTNITAILQSYGATSLLNYMDTYWKDENGNDESFWDHEWEKHGTCISTLRPTCYNNYTPQEEVVDFFNRTVQLFQTLNSYQFLANAGILPSTSTTYTSSNILAALKAPRGYDATISCTNNALDQIFYYFNVLGSVQTGTFEATNPDGSKSACPSTGIQYLPKSGSSPAPTSTPPTTTTTTTTATPPTGTSGTFSGSGYLNVRTGGAQDGCIISAGTWYTSGTCATFKAAAASGGGGFTLTSSKGKCAIVNDAFSCSSSVGTAGVFTDVDGNLAVGGNTAFYASAVAAGSTQETVTTTSQTVVLTISWQSI